MKEKVNTHFSFPPRLDMAPYMESNLIKKERLQGKEVYFKKKNFVFFEAMTSLEQ